MSLPERVKVGCLTYRIVTDPDEIKKHSDNADVSEDAEWSAFSNHDRLLIGVNADNPEGVQRRDVLHELLHCCLRLAGAWPDQYADLVNEARGRHGGRDVEEYAVAGITGPLLGVLRDNPALTEWLARG